MPNRSRETFELLEQNGIITQATSKNMKKMVGFRNIAVHDYTNLNIEIVKSIIENNIKDFNLFIQEIFENYLQ